MTSIPKRTCVKRDVLKMKGTSFSQWLQDSNNLYIHKNLAKYGKKHGFSDSIWYKDVKELQTFVNDEDEDYLSVYEKCIRRTPELWKNLDNLENKVLGCWCKSSQTCHADVLIKLYKEKKNDAHKTYFMKKNKH